MESVIRTAIEDVLNGQGFDEVDFVVEHPSDMAHGDYSTNVALVIAKQASKSPRACAEEIAVLLKDQIEYVDGIEVAGAGFINFTLSRDFFVQEVVRAQMEGAEWGKNDSWKGKTVLVEYTDPNPFKEFHIGHLFTNSVGESIARLFMMAGADVKRVNYQGDVGMHVAYALWGMKDLGITPDTEFSPRDLGKAYAHGVASAKDNESVQTEVRRINKAIYERSDEEINALYDMGRSVSLAYFDQIYALVDTSFDHFFFESQTAEKGKELVLAHPEIFEESDGALIFKGEEYGLHTRVFVNKEGLPTYEAKELALAQVKYEVYPYDHSVISTANEIGEYFKVLKKAMSFVYPELAEKTEHIGHGMVRLEEGKMSSRTGSVIPALDFINDMAEAVSAKMSETKEGLAKELLNDIAVGAIKYATLKSNIAQDSIFSTAQALSLEGDSGPYLQYTHARANSVLEKARGAGVHELKMIPPEAPYQIERLLYRFPDVVEYALHEREPHRVATYLTALASAFNTFYAEEKIADVADQHASYKMVLTEAVKTTLKNGLFTLGIKAPERM